MNKSHPKRRHYKPFEGLYGKRKGSNRRFKIGAAYGAQVFKHLH